MTLFSPVIARHAVTLAWTLTRCLPDFYYQQTQGLLNPSVNWLPLPKRAIVFGTGSIGMQIAKILNAEGIEVIGVKKKVQKESLPNFTGLCDRNSFLKHLSNVDWCFLALPYTSETEGMFNEKVMRNLPSHGVLVNVGRGETIITEDLCRLLREKHLGGAALDVIYPKPTAANDSIWKTPRLVVTPHVAAHYRNRNLAIERFCEQQVHRFISNQPLINLVKLAAN